MDKNMIVVYQPDGTIGRVLRGDPDMDNRGVADGGGFIEVDGGTDVSGKMVDTETGELVEDEDYQPPMTIEERIDAHLRKRGLLD